MRKHPATEVLEFNALQGRLVRLGCGEPCTSVHTCTLFARNNYDKRYTPRYADHRSEHRKALPRTSTAWDPRFNRLLQRTPRNDLMSSSLTDSTADGSSQSRANALRQAASSSATTQRDMDSTKHSWGAVLIPWIFIVMRRG